MQNGNIGIELRYLNNLIRRYVDNKLHKKYIDSVTGTNGWIIGYIADHGDVYQKDLETEFGITRSTASKAVSYTHLHDGGHGDLRPDDREHQHAPQAV